MNLARVYCQAGKGDEAKAYVLRVLQFSPDLGPSKRDAAGAWKVATELSPLIGGGR
jgi:hypothetical protein